ncbi:protein Wnt-8a-like [Clupea harengus]|uniref:Protein Wnt n=1 Tax=Clupea harengus TaxID=7950 RepID=A0A8M1KMR7_CLUHA|nr:protein Wnt-8a-like [Clupea harengus]
MLLLCCLWVLLTSSRIVPSCAWVLNSVLMSSPKAHLTYASSVQAGARNGIEECKQQFAWDRWNCPESALHLTTPGRLRAGTMSFCRRTNITRLKSLI